MKQLKSMCAKELSALFPIVLTPPCEDWKAQYGKEKALLSEILEGNGLIKIHHIGSTAIGGIWSKPTVDILVEVRRDCGMRNYKETLERNGYTCMSESVRRLSFAKGYSLKGLSKEVFHLHMRFFGDNAELYFRDYLTEHAEVAKEYEELKRALWKKFEFDRDGYTDAKTAFMTEYTRRAKMIYGIKYGVPI